jgi:hypothetical protein
VSEGCDGGLLLGLGSEVDEEVLSDLPAGPGLLILEEVRDHVCFVGLEIGKVELDSTSSGIHDGYI